MAMKKLLLASLMLSSSQAIASADFTVSDIQFEGLQRVTLGAALLQSPIRVGDRVNDADISALIRALFRSGNYEDVQVARQGNTIVVTVRERPTIASIVYAGNDDLKEEQLAPSLEAAGLAVGEALDRTALGDIEKSLEDFYYSVGKYNADVQAVVTPLPRNRVDVRLVFKEGEAAKIRQINFVGNEQFSDDDLAAKMQLSANLPWWDFFGSDKYQKQALAGDLESIRSFYLDRGYLKFRVEQTSVSLSPNKQDVYVTFTVSEGEPYTVESIALRGDAAGLKDQLMAKLPLKVGDVYNGSAMTGFEEQIKKSLADVGYAYPQIQTIPEFDDENQTVKLYVNIEPGERIYVRSIQFTGNTVTKDEVLRREMRQMEGAWLNAASIETGKTRLNRLGFFETVDVRTERVPGTTDQVDIIYDVAEANVGSVNFGVGYGNESGVSFQIGLQQDNFAGTGNRLGISAMTNDFQQNISLEYRDPYFTMDGVSLGGKIYYNKFEASDANIVDYTNSSYGASLSWGFPFDELNYFDFSIGYDHNKISNPPQHDQARKFAQSLGIDEINDGSTIETDDFFASISWSRNNLNKSYFPTAGNYQRAYFKITTPGSDVQFFKAQYDVRQYLPLTKSEDFTLLMRGRLGYGNGYGSSEGGDYILPFYENYYAGGFSSLRGFRSNTAGPKAVYSSGCNGGGNNNCITEVTDDSTGGNAVALASLELIFPTPFLEESTQRQVRTSFFVDAASVWDTEATFQPGYTGPGADQYFDYSDPGNIRASYGVALQWMSPMGPLVFSVAQPIKSFEGDDEEFFTFTIGQTF
ncbi:Outer membrane protein assembly factor BamA [Vibrio stylophorae]|uniref:Outer membrane protein assembly factor BamA n=1 Tax=Vibrio stylophorae TaxID=659351 RepID=A0ABM8ZW45_9VIBR|nr:outer membrane protein assembly factor BamA [Vibrio stylophorae]CAH0534228.1 Outer membrane protein assembly factor BamA [Vibrio stylophorae]